MPRPTTNRRSAAQAADPAGDPRADWLLLDRQLCFALYAASLATTKIYKPLLARLGLTYPQYLVMLVLWEQDGPSVSELGARLGLDSGTLTPLLKRMETQALLRRQRSEADERRVHVELTPSGKRLRARALDIPAQIACATGCDLAEVAQLTARLHELRRQLSASTHFPTP
jgi:MarR family transcriptional regulator, organic hydroperoxide resistance regulator